MAEATFANLSNLEATTLATLANLTNLESEKFGTYAFSSLFEKVVISTFASLADLVYYVTPPVVIPRLKPEIFDIRAESLSNPVVKAKIGLTVSIGSVSIATKLILNSLIRIATVHIPGLSGQTALLEIIDEQGGTIYSSGAMVENGVRVLGTTTNYLFPIAGGFTVKITLSASQSTEKTVTVILYGT